MLNTLAKSKNFDMEESLKIKLLSLAKKETPLDDDSLDLYVCDIVDTDVDEAFKLGLEYGKIHLAREILKLFCIKY